MTASWPPIKLQEHGKPVRYQNVCIAELDD
jgi:hypothetical protein